ncbi:TetR/AcrR family transcriptional regulator C-terminal domain-containing protein, partial [Achromobacter sp.]|uniref:TetR/AcrR family transcriptional regulator C-terminal domain-containing protein n=1 Tax=Achromobacter sp. TaxID=134375 RepID=UPI0028B0BC68
GGSKRTLYGYFESKEDLFAAVSLKAAEELFGPIFGSLADTDDPLPVCLHRFGEGLILAMCNEQTVRTLRTMIGVAGRSELGAQFYAAGPATGVAQLTEFFLKQIDAGALRPCDANVAAQHFLGLVQSETLLPSLLVSPQSTPEQILKDAAKRAVDVFLKAYGSC